MEEELQKVKSDRSLLKKSLIKEREERKKLERRMEDSDIDNRRKTEEIEGLRFANAQLETKCQTLQTQMKDLGQGWTFWKSRPRDDVLKMQNALQTVQEDLRVKIEENGTNLCRVGAHQEFRDAGKV
jgi:chromosome segregation ATPase